MFAHTVGNDYCHRGVYAVLHEVPCVASTIPGIEYHCMGAIAATIASLETEPAARH